MDLEKRIEELEIDVRLADARADAALQLAFRLLELVQEKGLYKGDVENFARRLFEEVTEREDPAYELALLDEWQSSLVPKNLAPGDAYADDQRRRIRLRREIAKSLHQKRTE